MFAIAYDMAVAAAKQHHPRSCRQAYLDIESTLNKFGFKRVQDSVFVSKDDDLANFVQRHDGSDGIGMVRTEREGHSRVSNGSGFEFHSDREGAAYVGWVKRSADPT